MGFSRIYIILNTRYDSAGLNERREGNINTEEREHSTMKIRLHGLFFCIGLSLTILTITQNARAALGEPAESIAKDIKALSSARRATTTRNSYTVQEIVSDANTVREYVNTSGIVFAIAWNGLTHPDLTPLLGSYAGEYQKALQKTIRVPGRRHLQVKSNNVVVEKWGHMRNLQGRAYIPALMPQGVSIDEIR